MKNKNILIGVFANKNKLLSLLEQLKVNFKIDLNKIRIFTIESKSYEYLITFQALSREQFLKNIENSTVIHAKNGCLFSINALNKLIESESGSIDKDYLVDWEKYKDTLLILTNGNLSINKINKVEDKCSIIFGLN